MKQKENIKEEIQRIVEGDVIVQDGGGGSERNIKAKVKMINVKRMRKDIMEIELNMNEKEENKGAKSNCVRQGHYNETPGSE